MKKLFLPVFAGAVLLSSGPAFAEEGHRELGAHAHGHGTLNMAIEGNKVAMELVAPGADIVGFEHKPSTDKQKAQLKAAIETLEKDAAKLFVFSADAKCTFASAEAEVEAMEEHEGHEHEGHDHAKEAKKDDHDHDHDHKKDAKKDDHDHDHKHEKEAAHEDEAAHSEFHVAYELECAAPGELKALDVQFFKQFPNSKELEVTVVDDTGSKTHVATPDAAMVKLGK